ncbi:MAG TPA: hypothetical protein VK822_13205 [Acetobacteraceae bacterium]|jgi:hypothetical protein|nr:hypothetical protein [Acetobacteraceae bacterium]
MGVWWDEATKLEFASQNGGAYVSGPFRGVIHTTEDKSYTPSTTSYYGHHNPPHFTLVMERDVAKFYQHFPINVAARALEHNANTVDTNQRSAIQIELAWKAAEIADIPEAMLERLWDWMRWAESQTSIRSSQYSRFVGEADGKGYDSSSRMTDDEWLVFNGWCGHQHVPGNRHWDPGKLDIGRLLRITRPGTPPRCEVAGWFGVNAI